MVMKFVMNITLLVVLVTSFLILLYTAAKMHAPNTHEWSIHKIFHIRDISHINGF